jgi:hypothetical protein
MLRQILVTDRRHRPPFEPDVVVWLGRGAAPGPPDRGALVVAPSSVRSAAVYVATAGPTELRLDLTDPMEFVDELVRVNSVPALRAA